MVTAAKPLHQIVLECDVPRLQQPTQKERKTLDVYSVEGRFNAFAVPLSKDPIHCIPHIQSRAPFLPEYFNGKFYVVTAVGFGLPEVDGVQVADDSMSTVEENYIRSRTLIRCGTRTTYYQPNLAYYRINFFFEQLRSALGTLYEQVENQLPTLKECEREFQAIEEKLASLPESDAPEVLAEVREIEKRAYVLRKRYGKQMGREVSRALKNERVKELLSQAERLQVQHDFALAMYDNGSIPPFALYALNPEFPALRNVVHPDDLEDLADTCQQLLDPDYRSVMDADTVAEIHVPFRSYNFRPKDPTAIRELPNVERCVHLGTQAVQVVNPQQFLNARLVGWTITYLCQYHFAAYYLGEREKHDMHHQQENSQVRVLDLKKPPKTYINVASVFPSKVHVRADLQKYFELIALSFEWPDRFSRSMAVNLPRTY